MKMMADPGSAEHPERGLLSCGYAVCNFPNESNMFLTMIRFSVEFFSCESAG